MKRLRTLKSFQIFKTEIKKSKTYCSWSPFQGLFNGTTLVQIQSGRTVPFKYRHSFHSNHDACGIYKTSLCFQNHITKWAGKSISNGTPISQKFENKNWNLLAVFDWKKKKLLKLNFDSEISIVSRNSFYDIQFKYETCLIMTPLPVPNQRRVQETSSAVMRTKEKPSLPVPACGQW